MVLLLALLGCAAEGFDTPPDDAVDTPAVDTPADTDVAGEPACAPVGTPDCPVEVTTFPTVDARTTVDAPRALWDAYACAPDTDESGGEVVYAVTVPGPGALIAAVDDLPGVDIDVHLLDAADPATCRARDDVAVTWVVDGGTVFVVADTWVDGDGQPHPGEYLLRFDFVPLPTGSCAFAPRDLAMVWPACAPGIDCEDAGGQSLLHTPSAGPVVKEAHLVTVDDDFGGGWPDSFTEKIRAHYALSEAASGYVMERDEPWAPAGEGGSEYGQGSTGSPLPVLDEAWYLNMYWRNRPAKGTRMVVWNPATNAVVIAAGGYETGPGDASHVAGVTEEIHDALGTGHLDTLVVGFAADEDAALGPARCP